MNPLRRKLLLAGVAGVPGLAGATPAQVQPAALRLGLAPFLSPSALLTVFRPLREHLERQLQQPVQAYTARHFRALVDAVQRADYDIALVPAHLAALAVADWRWQPLARTITATQVRVLVRTSGPVADAARLRGGTVGMLDSMSLTAAVGDAWLTSQQLDGPGGARTVAMPSINSALVALARDEVLAVVAATTQLAGLPPATPDGYRTLAALDHIPGPMLIGQPDAAAATVQAWQQALLAFEPDLARPTTAANARHTALTQAHLPALAPYADHLRRQLAGGR